MKKSRYSEVQIVRVLEEVESGKPVSEEAREKAVLLLSDKLSGYTTGASLVIDGGISLRVLPWRTEEELREMNQ